MSPSKEVGRPLSFVSLLQGEVPLEEGTSPGNKREAEAGGKGHCRTWQKALG